MRSHGAGEARSTGAAASGEGVEGETTHTTPGGSKPHLEELTYSPKASLASSPERAARSVDSEQKVAVSLSHEIPYHSSKVPSVVVLGTTSSCRYHVRHGDAGGVRERGEAASGWAWNTGCPSETEEPSRMVDTGLTTTQRMRPAGGLVCAKKPACNPLTSGSLSFGIVAFERWGTADGPDPLGSEGQNLVITTSAVRHGAHTPG